MRVCVMPKDGQHAVGAGVCQSQGDCVHGPKVGAPAPTLGRRPTDHHRNAVAAIRFWFDVCVTLATTPLGLMISVGR